MRLTRNSLRFLIVLSLIFAIVGGVYDYLWPDWVTQQVSDYAIELEVDSGSGELLVVWVVVLITLMAVMVASFVGLLLFTSWSRPLFVTGFLLLIPLYPFMGVLVYSGASQLFYDLSMLTSGAIMALIYFSPAAEFYQQTQ